METHEQMEARIRAEMEIRQQVQKEQYQEKTRKARKKGWITFFITLIVVEALNFAFWLLLDFITDGLPSWGLPILVAGMLFLLLVFYFGIFTKLFDIIRHFDRY